MRALLVLCLSMVFPGAFAAPDPVVASFSPQGEVTQVRQVTARFSTPMVAFGDLRAPSPFAVDCAEKGSGRWIDDRTWSYDFERDLPGAVSCRFALAAGGRDLVGQALAGQREFSFNTGGPAIVQSLPQDGQSGIDEQQVFILALDAVASEDSIARHAWCQADGIPDKIGVRVITGKERDDFLELRRNFLDRHLTVYFRERGVLWRAGVRVRSQRAQQLPVAVLQCRRTLPANAKVALVWGAGIAAENGIANGQDHRIAFRTRPDFTARVSCQRAKAKGGCIPFLPVQLGFSAPVSRRDTAAIHLDAPGGKPYPAVVDAAQARSEFVSQVSFTGPFPEKATLTLHLPPGLKDDAGRSLVNRARFPLAVRTDEQPPLVKFAAPFGIIESHGDRLLPVTVRNVEARLAGQMQAVGTSVRVAPGHDEEVIRWLKEMSGGRGGRWNIGQQWGDSFGKQLLSKAAAPDAGKFILPKPGGRRAFEVVGIPLRRPGFYVVELASPRLGAVLNGKGGTAYVRSAALVTNMAAHFKHGAQSSLVWVTSLDKGRPVPGAQVVVRDCAGKALWNGTTDPEGVARIKGELPASHCGYGDGDYFVSARSGDDFTFTLSDWQQGIEAWRFHLDTGSLTSDTRLVATVFDRTLLRAGDTVHMKHFLRRHTTGGIALVGAGEAAPAPHYNWRMNGEDEREPTAQPGKMWLVHEGSNDKVELPLRWDAAGNAHNEWTIPTQAKLGVYSVLMGGEVAGTFRVEQFRVPTMKALLSGPREAAVAPQALSIDAQVSYLSGGPASLAPVKLRTVVQDRSVQFADYEGYTFSTGDVKEGVVKEGAFDEDEGEWVGGEDEGEGADESGQKGAARTQSLSLDRAGGARIVVDKLPPMATPKTLLAELSFQDANGESSTVSSRIPLWPSRYVVGIKPDAWLASRDALKFTVAVLDVQGKPVGNAQVAVDFFQRAMYSHRRRLVGGFYAYENVAEVKRLGAACEGRTDAHGLLLCQVKAPAEGNLILRARAADEEGRATVTQHDVWVAGKRNAWFSVTDNDRIDLLPEKKRYEPGETARLQVRSPFREATALVTVEREGIVDTYVRHVSGSEPVIELPVKGSYAPNVFVSAMLVRGRVAGVQPTALVDLGKPAYKLGIVPLRVGWAAHELKVRVAADKEVYKVRERAQVRVKVSRADGSAPPAGAEVAIAAVDAGLLELMPNQSWNLLEAMMGERALQVQTSTAQMQVVGKRHFGRKAFPHGGGGGRGESRELFDTLLLWKGKVALDANGEASVQVPLNDSLTSFRIVAVASAGAGLFGSGDTEVRSSQDLMLVSGLPQLVREGDAFRAGFTLRNTSTEPMQVQLAASVAADGAKPAALAPQALSLAPGQAQEVGWDYRTPQAKTLHWQVEARAGGALDRIRISQKVVPAVPVRTLQATLLQLDGPQSMKVERPAGALPGYGGVQTSFSARLGGDLPGVRAYMGAYPYTCFEQLTSRAVALGDAPLWKANMAALPTHMDADGMVKYFALMEQGSDSLTAYVLSVAAEAGYEIPAPLKEKMEGALLAFVEGKLVRGPGLATGELAVRKLAALEALSRSGHVRPGLLESFTIEPNLWPTSAVIDWYLVLQRTGEIPGRDAKLAQAAQILRARLNLQGTTMGFSTEQRDDWWWLMASPDVNANRLLLAMLDNPAWKADMGRLARGTLGRQQKGHWRTTLANAWGVLALDKFSQRFEAQPVTGTSSAALSGPGAKTTAWSGTAPASVLQAWPEHGGELALRHQGTGKPWATVQSLAAVPLTAPLSSGYRITRTVTPVEQKTKGTWSRGDIYRVHLDLEAQSDMTWVVVDDPVPASASILGSGLGRDSQIATGGEKQRGGWVEPAFQERKADAFRSYFEFVPKGKWSVEYTVRLNNEGRFILPPTHVEAMYSPEMFGDVPNAPMVVGH